VDEELKLQAGRDIGVVAHETRQTQHVAPAEAPSRTPALRDESRVEVARRRELRLQAPRHTLYSRIWEAFCETAGMPDLCRRAARDPSGSRELTCTYTARNMYGMNTDTRPERFELRLSEAEAAILRSLAAGAGVSAADYLRQRIRAAWTESRAKLEHLAIVSLNEMVARKQVACGVAFVSPPGLDPMPRKLKGDVAPQPVASSVLQAPMVGNVVTQGFDRTLSEAEKTAVAARFPGQLATWMMK